MSNCPKCGNPVQEETDICPICGTSTASAASETPVVTEEPTQDVVIENVQEPTPTPAQDMVPVVAPAEENPIPVIEEAANDLSEPAPEQAPVEETTPEMPTMPVMEQPQESPIPVIEQSAPAPENIPVMEPTAEFSSADTSIPVMSPAPEFSAADTVNPVVPQKTEFSSAAAILPIVNLTSEFVSADVPTQEPVQQVESEPVQPVQENIAPAPEMPAIEPAPVVETSSVPVAETPVVEQPKTEEETSTDVSGTKQETKPNVKKGLNKKTLLIIIIIVAVVAGGGMLLMGGTGGAGNVPVNPNPTGTVVASSVSSNGFKFNLQEGWLIREDGNNVIITNTDETVVIKLESSKTSFSNLTKEKINAYYSGNANFKDITVDATKISARDSFLVNASSGTLQVQAYYINGGSNLTLGSTIIYQSADSKTKYEAVVTELMGSISYSDDSLKAISTIEMYSEVFGAYKGVFNYQSPYIDVTPTPDNTPNTEGTEVEDDNQNQDNAPVENETVEDESSSENNQPAENGTVEEPPTPETTE